MIIDSLLDTDLYKFTMMQVVLHHFPEAQVEYRFKCRTPDVDLTPYIAEIERELAGLGGLLFARRELEYLRGWRFLKSDFVDLLGLFHLQDRFVDVRRSAVSPKEIEIAIIGPWLHTILFEVPVLAIVSEVYFRNTRPRPDFAEGRRRLAAKIEQINAVPDPEFRVADYGTRRRFSGNWQEEVILALKKGIGAKFVGTSNVYFALEHGLTPLGTMAHEYLQACLAGGRAEAARFAGLCVQHLGARISRRPRYRAVRRMRDGSVPARLRSFLLQAVRWRASRFRRSFRMGRETHRALRQDAYRPENQDHGFLGRTQRAAGGSAV